MRRRPGSEDLHRRELYWLYGHITKILLNRVTYVCGESNENVDSCIAGKDITLEHLSKVTITSKQRHLLRKRRRLIEKNLSSKFEQIAGVRADRCTASRTSSLHRMV